MSGPNIITLSCPIGDGRTLHTLYMFFGDDLFGADDVDAAVAAERKESELYDEVVIAGGCRSVEKIRKLLNGDNAVRDRLTRLLRNIDTDVKLISFDLERREHVCQNLAGVVASPGESGWLYGRLSLMDAFKKANGLMHAPRGYHYKKPSGVHANAFLRASNVIETGANISALTFWLLRFVGRNRIRRIVVDTSGIAAVAVDLAYQAHTLGLTEVRPVVESHASYGGLDRLAVSEADDTLVLISASTSGTLAKAIIDKGICSDSIVTLFYLGDEPCLHGQVLCDLSFDQAINPFGLKTIENYKAADCQYCREMSCPVSIEGDQFTLEPPREEYCVINKADAPRAQLDVLNRFLGVGLFKAFKTSKERAFEIYLDVEALYSKSLEQNQQAEIPDRRRFFARWDQLVRRGLPIHAKRVVYTTYDYSETLARTAADEFKQHSNGFQLEVLSAVRLADAEVMSGSATLVVAACIDEPNEVMAVNRDLRDLQPGGNVTYLTPLMRSRSSEERKRLVSNVTFGEHGPNTFNLYYVDELLLPRCDPDHSWVRELRLLRALQQWADLNDFEVPREVGERIVTLERAPSQGLVENLFWPSVKGAALALRSDFTLVDTDSGRRNLSQADVFVVMSSVLHHLREGVRGSLRLTYGPYQRTVLSPDNFERFNDGVIQAAILRAARGFELAFGNCQSDRSEQLTAFLISQVHRIERGEGEALMEFLIALGTRRLTLHPEHELRLHSAVLSQAKLPEYLKLLAKYREAELRQTAVVQ